ncbi:MAG: macro domain-containing protein [Candidatus Omnitrophica bacterium]|nr:macro domain-containing protein [Candidatus Omnitrophota bacterium]
MHTNAKSGIPKSKIVINAIKDIFIIHPAIGMIFIVGIFLIFTPFFKYDRTFGWQFPICPSGLIWVIPGLGGLLLIIATCMCCFIGIRPKIFNKRIDISKTPLKLIFGRFTVNVKAGEIQDISNSRDTEAVVLCANTTFIDECVADKHSTFGVFNLTHCPEKIQELREYVKKQLESIECRQDADSAYPLGTTVNLSAFYQKLPVKVFLVASTSKKKAVGFKANPTSICECIRQVFETTADQRISSLRMPILGSGHGGLPINSALVVQLASIKHYFTIFSHIKFIDIIVLEKDTEEIPDYIKNLQYTTLPL